MRKSQESQVSKHFKFELKGGGILILNASLKTVNDLILQHIEVQLRVCGKLIITTSALRVCGNTIAAASLTSL